MISSTTTSDDNNNNVSLSVVQTVKKWIRNSWPFATTGKIDERRPDHDDAARQEGEVLYIHQDECASVDDETTVLDGDRRYEEKCRDDNEASGDAVVVEDYGSDEALSASLSNGQHDSDDNKAGSRVMDIVMASPKKYFLRSSRRRRSCRFQLDDDEKIDVVARSSNDDESVMASGHFGGLNDTDRADSSKVSSTINNHDDRSKQDNDNNDKVVDELAAPALPQDTSTTTTNHSYSWTQQEITSLRKAYQQSNPTSPTLWQDISTAMNGSKRSASECQRKWFSLVAPPKKRVGRRKNGRVNDVKNKYGVEEDGSEEEEDLFDSTPLKCAVQEIENGLLFHQRRRRTTAAATSSAAATAKKEGLVEQDSNDTTFHSPNKIMAKMMIKSPLSKRPRMFSPKNKNSSNGGMKNDGILSPLINRRKGYNTYVNNLRREIGRAQKARKGDDDKMMSDGNIGSCGNNSSRGGGRGKGGGSTANKSTIRIKEGKGKSQLSAELVLDGSSFVLNIPQDDSDDENGSDVDLFEEVFRMEDEENEFPCD